MQERSKLLCRIADILEARLEEFAEAESRDQGRQGQSNKISK